MEIDRIDAAIPKLDKSRYLTHTRVGVEVNRIDAAVLTEELAEIYSTPTPKGWPEPKKVNNWYLIDCVSFTIVGL